MIIVVIPAYNEEKRVAKVVVDARAYADVVLVVDDGSTDRTGDVAREAGAVVVRHLENAGPGAATMTPIKDGRADIVFANRFGRRNSIPFIRRLFNAVGNVLTLLAAGKWVSDSQCGFKVFGPRSLAEVDLRMSGFEFCTEIVREAAQRRWRIAEIPSKVIYSEYTMAKGQSFANGVKTALKILLRSFLR